MSPKIGGAIGDGQLLCPQAPELFAEKATIPAELHDALGAAIAETLQEYGPIEATGTLELTVRRYLSDDPSPGMPKVSDVIAGTILPGTILVMTAPTGSGKTTFWKYYQGKAVLVVPYRALAQQLHREGFTALYGGQQFGDPTAEKIVVTYDMLAELVKYMGDSIGEYVLFIDEPQEIPNASNYRGRAISDLLHLAGRFKAQVYMSATTEKVRRYFTDNRVEHSHIRVSTTHGPQRKASILDAKIKELPRLIVDAHERTGKPVAVLYDDKKGCKAQKRYLVKRGFKPSEIAIINSSSKPTAAEKHIHEHGTFPPGIKVLLTTKKISAGPNIAGAVVPIVVDAKYRKADDVVQFFGRFRNNDTHGIILRTCPTYNVESMAYDQYLKMLRAVQVLDEFGKWCDDERKMRKDIDATVKTLLMGGKVAAWELSQQARDRVDMEEGLVSFLERHGIETVPMWSLQAEETKPETLAEVAKEIATDRAEALEILTEDPAAAIGEGRAYVLRQDLDLSENSAGAVVLDEAHGEGLDNDHDKLCRDYVKARAYLDHDQAVELLRHYERAGKPLQAIRARHRARQILEQEPTTNAEKVVHALRDAFSTGESYTKEQIEDTTAEVLKAHKMDVSVYYGDPRKAQYWYFAHLYWTFERHRESTGKRRWVYRPVAYADPFKLLTRASGIVDLESVHINGTILRKERVSVDGIAHIAAA